MGVMIAAVVSTLFWLGVAASGVGHLVSAPFIAATSSQYFARTFNRLVEAPRVLAPVLPPIVVAPLPADPTVPTAAPQPTVQPLRPTDDPVRPVVAIATAQALVQPLFINSPVPVPGGIVAPQFQFLRLGENSDSKLQNRVESTKTTVPSNSNFESRLNLDISKPSIISETNNQQSSTQDNFEEQFKQQQQFLARQHQEIIRQQKLIKQERYLNQQQLIKQQQLVNQLQLQRQQQLMRQQQAQIKTSVEIVPVPLAYIAPPPVRFSSALRQLHTFVPAGPFGPSGQLRLAPLKTHARLTAYNSEPPRANNPGILQNPRSRDVEPTTFRIPRFNNVTRPPRK